MLPALKVLRLKPTADRIAGDDKLSTVSLLPQMTMQKGPPACAVTTHVPAEERGDSSGPQRSESLTGSTDYPSPTLHS